LATGNRVVMFEHAVYSVISPEGCASILWRSSEKAQIAAEALRLTAQDMKQLGVIDAIVDEPLGGAHRQIEQALESLSAELLRQLDELQGLSAAELRADRRKKYVTIGDAALA
ncbi:MAG: acetyl-CoA carboxylase carboxyl transferase subunit alpha, partial [Pseudomonadota bacterium]|nr:acetyl-CoA carboxylase carboxyl transferase subunit alpha [Pseudomonadota bacterium]